MSRAILVSVQQIVETVQQLGAKAIIDRFDEDFDMTMHQGWAIHCLGLMGKFQRPTDSDDFEARANYLGSHWCRIVTQDVRHEFEPALESIDETNSLARECFGILIDNCFADIQDASLQYFAYVVARWHDSVGKINFRSNDYIDAWDYFDRALQIVERFSLERCRADIASNRLRAEYERDFGLDPYDRRPVDDLIKEFMREIGRACVDVHTNQHDESRRGLAGLHQNLSVLLAREKRATESTPHATRSEEISTELNDTYRIAQARFSHARVRVQRFRQELKVELLHEALEIFNSVFADPRVGQRTKLLAHQNVGEIQALLGNLETANTIFRSVLESLSMAKANGGELGYDLPAQAWTVQLIRDHCSNLYETAAGRLELRRLRLEVARSGRKIVKVAKYKHDYSRTVYPLFCELARTSESADECLALIEEVSGRELLDMLAGSEKLAPMYG